jgi:hypothetical protein
MDVTYISHTSHTYLTYMSYLSRIYLSMKQKLKGGDEWDWVSKYWRKMFRWHPGEGKIVKRRMNKRARKEAKQAVYDELG